jgi:hypothetical protein
MEAEKEKPRGGERGGDRGGDRGGKPRGGPKKSDEPKYNDTDECKAQLEKIRLIEAQMKEVQQKLVSGLTPGFLHFFFFPVFLAHETVGRIAAWNPKGVCLSSA